MRWKYPIGFLFAAALVLMGCEVEGPGGWLINYFGIGLLLVAALAMKGAYRGKGD